jgi:predicted site-specific integrase-resolvase
LSGVNLSVSSVKRRTTYTTAEFAELVGRSERTLYAWARKGWLVPDKDFTGKNIYTDDHYNTYLNSRVGRRGGS